MGRAVLESEAVVSGLAYASTHVEFIDEAPLWALVAFTIFASTVIHGLTATATIDVLDREYTEGDGADPDNERHIPKSR